MFAHSHVINAPSLVTFKLSTCVSHLIKVTKKKISIHCPRPAEAALVTSKTQCPHLPNGCLIIFTSEGLLEGGRERTMMADIYWMFESARHLMHVSPSTPITIN